jgi:hypothetical protein
MFDVDFDADVGAEADAEVDDDMMMTHLMVMLRENVELRPCILVVYVVVKNAIS